MQPIPLEEWQDHQEFEKNWHGDCCNTLSEELKQITYATRMGIPMMQLNNGHWPTFNAQNKLIVDIGGGPVSMLLKFENRNGGVVVDPCTYPGWIKNRYLSVGILPIVVPAEKYNREFTDLTFDMALCYNVLQHTMDPKKIVENMRAISKEVRIFEWIDTPPTLGHPHTLTEQSLNEWLGGEGTVEHVNENGAVGLAYYGVFPQ